jgi:hypothetical protein
MKRFICIVIVAIASGCASTTSTQQAGFRRNVDARFDLIAVRSFLIQLIREHPGVDGVAIAKSKVGETWLLDESWLPIGLTAEQWTFQRTIGSESDFDLSYRADLETAIIFHCHSDHRGRFKVLSFGKEQLFRLSDGRFKI